MNRRPNSSGGDRSNLDIARRSVVVVAVRASEEIQRAALEWALTNVVRPGDCVRLLVLIPAHTSSKRLWGFSKFHSDCTAAHWRFLSGTKAEQKEYVTMICNQMMCELQDMYDPGKVKVKLKVIYESKDGVVASEAKKVQTQWIILEKEMKKEAKCCVEQLDCNVIVVTNSGLKVLRLNLAKPNKPEKELLPSLESCRKHVRDDLDMLKIIKVPNVTPTSSPDRLSSVSSLDMIYSPKFMSEINLEPKVKQIFTLSLRGYSFCESDTESDSDNPSTLSASLCSHKWMEDNMSSADEASKNFKGLWRTGSLGKSFMSDSTCPFSKIFTAIEGVQRDTNSNLQNNMREMISQNKNTLPSPPLCSVCCHKTPSMGEPPRLFSYAELEKATTGFSQVNFLAEGGFGSVYRGVLQDGLVVAVKQQKLASTQGDREFCSEVQVLSCAQHRNVVMLIGYCAEENRRLLVYEYICNGSLDAHLYGRNQAPLNWAARQKIAVGASRGLRYLHEECRVGCIVHRDLRPNNILLTHDFEPLVGDFGLARLQPDGELGVETQVIGTFGYLAPEYAQTGQVSEKADVYSFGVVLLDLITGRKAVDINRPKGQQCLTEWARPLAKENALAELIDPCLIDCYSEKEAEVMLHCASLCLQRDSQSRPRMSQVLRMLEGDILKCDEMALPLDDPENGH